MAWNLYTYGGCGDGVDGASGGPMIVVWWCFDGCVRHIMLVVIVMGGGDGG